MINGIAGYKVRKDKDIEPRITTYGIVPAVEWL